MLRVEAVDTINRSRFIRYAAEHGSEHDDSYLPGPGFEPSPEHPAYLLLQDDVVIGAASLMRTPRYLQAGRSRFSIFHSTDPVGPNLLAALCRHPPSLRWSAKRLSVPPRIPSGARWKWFASSASRSNAIPTS